MSNVSTITPIEPTDFLCRVGCYAHVGRFRSSGTGRFGRGDSVLCRTGRGLELAEILGDARRVASNNIDGTLLRRVTTEDELLRSQLQKYSQDAFADCQAWLNQEGHSDVLLEVEPLMDGQTLYFHFLGQPNDCLSDYLQALVSIYQQRVQESRFAQLLEHGCGPGCGTESKRGCGSQGGCAVCVVASACKNK